MKTLLAWDNAKANAAARTYNGKIGHLAVIGDAVENEFGRSLASAAGATTPIYIGLGKYPDLKLVGGWGLGVGSWSERFWP